MKKKNLLSMLAVYGIVLAVYILAFLIIPFKKGASAWICFGFSIVAFFAGSAISVFAFDKKDLKSKFYGFPIFKVGSIYVAAQLALGIVLCVIGAFIDIPYWITLLLSVIVLAVAAIGVIATGSARSNIENIEKTTEKEIQTHKVFTLNIEGIIDICNNDDVKVKLKKLAEDFKYSDPVSNKNTESIEDDIILKLESLKKNVNANPDKVFVDIQEVSNLLSERNRICKAFKH